MPLPQILFRKPRKPSLRTLTLGLSLSAAASLPSLAQACACGCGVFDLGANTAFPNMADSGWSIWARYNQMDQNRNWVGSSRADASLNADKDIKTSFYTFGAQYMVNHDWGVMVEMPVFDRSFTTTGDGGPYPAGQIATTKLTALGDVMVEATYAGFSPDMTTGVIFGVKLPTGDYTGPYIAPNAAAGTQGGMAYDRDTLPGSGSTDLLTGAYHVGGLTSDNTVAYFLQARYQFAVFTRDGATSNAQGAGYRPGNDLNLAAGLTADLGSAGPFSRVAPVLQLVASKRNADGGAVASPNSGYRRVLLAPGLDLRVGHYKIYANVSVPVYQNVNTDTPASGNYGQLVASRIWTLQLGYDL